ncbi:MAG: glycosyltransferase [Deltaproteobacteria bacterium]|nr:glycosyltransferase [Deltaproteobacteria bacterium]
MQKIILLIPALDDTGPIKGAVALANALTHYFSDRYLVSVITLKGKNKNKIQINSNIDLVDLKSMGSFYEKRKFLLRKLQAETKPLIVFSFCFSADLMNAVLVGVSKRWSSVRANNLINYQFTYGKLFGLILAKIHYMLLMNFDKVFAISEFMKNFLEKEYKFSNISLLFNFIDELALEIKRMPVPNTIGETFHFVFMGSLCKRKRPELLLTSFVLLKKKLPEMEMRLTFIGDGPLKHHLSQTIEKEGIQGCVELKGHLTDPYKTLQNADIFVLPSESEGVPRAALEALFFGLPCIMRNVDANSEIISDSIRGLLFERDEDLVGALLEAIEFGFRRSEVSLIPQKYKMRRNISEIDKILRCEKN